MILVYILFFMCFVEISKYSTNHICFNLYCYLLEMNIAQNNIVSSYKMETCDYSCCWIFFFVIFYW